MLESFIEVRVEVHAVGEGDVRSVSALVRAMTGWMNGAGSSCLCGALGVVRLCAAACAVPEHGVVVEHIPWSDGKRPLTTAMMGFLARWARRLSWGETAEVFQTSWEAVYRSVEWFVEWGLAHRTLSASRRSAWTRFMGHGLKANNFLTVIYQIDQGCRGCCGSASGAASGRCAAGSTSWARSLFKDYGMSAATCGSRT